MRASVERGSALLLSILATAVLGAGLMAVLMLNGSERRVVMNAQAQTSAYAVAETGLEQFAANRAALGFASSPAAAYESTRVTVSGGYADVVLQRLRPAVGAANAVYVMRSHGYATDARLSGTPLAERQVAQLAAWVPGSVSLLGAFTAINGLTKGNALGSLSGTDGCGVMPTTAGVAVGSPGYTQTSGTSIASGNPAVLSLGTQAQAAAAVRLDWSGISSGSAIVEDVALPSGTWPSFAVSTYWPVILVTGNFTLPGNGQGTLIVTGTLTISATRTWKGVILVGNGLTATGTTTVQGAVITGLNVKLGQSPAVSALGTGTRTVVYNSCNIASALNAFSALQLLPNAWMDDWDGW